MAGEGFWRPVKIAFHHCDEALETIRFKGRKIYLDSWFQRPIVTSVWACGNLVHHTEETSHLTGDGEQGINSRRGIILSKGISYHSNQLLSIRFYLLKVLPPPNAVTGWGPKPSMWTSEGHSGTSCTFIRMKLLKHFC